jgi:hypothetical protein
MTTSAPTAGVIPNAVQIKLHAMDEQFLQQGQWNSKIEHKLGALEEVTAYNGSKIDCILNKLESWDTPAKRREVIPNHEERSASSSLGFQGTEAMET